MINIILPSPTGYKPFSFSSFFMEARSVHYFVLPIIYKQNSVCENCFCHNMLYFTSIYNPQIFQNSTKYCLAQLCYKLRIFKPYVLNSLSGWWCKPDWLILTFIHLAVCLTTGPKPLTNLALHILRSRASCFNCEYPLLP